MEGTANPEQGKANQPPQNGERVCCLGLVFGLFFVFYYFFVLRFSSPEVCWKNRAEPQTCEFSLHEHVHGFLRAERPRSTRSSNHVSFLAWPSSDPKCRQSCGLTLFPRLRNAPLRAHVEPLLMLVAFVCLHQGSNGDEFAFEENQPCGSCARCVSFQRLKPRFPMSNKD